MEVILQSCIHTFRRIIATEFAKDLISYLTNLFSYIYVIDVDFVINRHVIFPSCGIDKHPAPWMCFFPSDNIVPASSKK